MKMQKWLMTVLALASFSIAGGLMAQSYKVDTGESQIEWKGTKVGGSHQGTIQFQSGTLTLTDGELTSGELIVDMNSMVNTDLPSEDKKAKLIEHLKSDDFFAVADNSTAKIVFKDVAKKSGNNYEVKGDFTVRGIEKPITFMAEIETNGDKLMGQSELTFDRSEHNVKYNSGSFFENLGDKLIYDDIQLDIDLTAKK